MFNISARFPRGIALHFALLPALILGGCSTMHVASDYDRGAQFSTYHSFTLLEHPHPSAGDPLVVQRTYDAIRADLTAKGFVYVADPMQADFAVDFTVEAADRLKVSSQPVAYGPFGFAPGWWGGTDIDVHQYKEGMLAIDVFDIRARRPVWHGSASEALAQSDIDHSQRAITEAVAAVLGGFPPK